MRKKLATAGVLAFLLVAVLALTYAAEGQKGKAVQSTKSGKTVLKVEDRSSRMGIVARVNSSHGLTATEKVRQIVKELALHKTKARSSRKEAKLRLRQQLNLQSKRLKLQVAQ
ncbi:MAG: hypothetical protein D6743_08465 [Calditrichaeota bacterium]|nr:MAG: hypothetical protein D6743_08465 [Calditrichota bacterium]